MWQEGGEAPFENTSDTKGEDIQKLSVIQGLPSLLAGDTQTCITRLMPKIQQTLPTASTEFHMAASTTFKTIVEQKLVSPSTFEETYLQAVLNSLDSREPDVAQAWLDTLLNVIESLPVEVIRQEILPMAINKGQLSQPISLRIMCSKIVGKICTRFDSQLIKKEVLPTVHSLCQDVNSEVRACICLQLRYVAEGLGPESVKPALLPSIVELASDEECIVRHASVQTIMHLLPQLQTDVVKNTIAPLIKKLCEGALESDDTVLCVIAQEFGKLALGLEKCLTPGEKTWLIKYYQQLSQLGVPTMKQESTKQEFPFISNNPLINERNVECRWQCAFNIPAMFLFVSSAVEDVEVLLPTFNDLASDPYYMVRRTIACGIHEVAKILGPRNHLIRGELIKLLKDDSEEVLQGLIPHVAVTFELLLQSQIIGPDKIDPSVMELGRALLKCEAEIATTNNWRLSALIFKQMEVLPKCFPSDFIHTYFVPVALTRALKARPMPVRLAAGRTLLVFLRYNLKASQRTGLRNRLYTEFALNRNSYVRMLYIHMMIDAMEIFSSTYFKEYFYSFVLALTKDPIANVRLKVVTLLPTLQSYIRLPSDKELLTALETNIRHLRNNEKDRDVVAALTNAIHKLESLDVPHEGELTSTKLNKQEAEDLRKYEEEKRLMTVTPGKTEPSSIHSIPPTLGTMKKLTIAPKLGGTNTRMSGNDGVMGRAGRTNPISAETPRFAMSTGTPPASLAPLPPPPSHLSRHSSPASRLNDVPKASTSSNDLTSSWAQLTSNSMLKTHLWERMNMSKSNISVSPINHAECASAHQEHPYYEPRESIDNTTNRYETCPRACEYPSFSKMNFSSLSSAPSYCEPEHDCARARLHAFYKHDYNSPSLYSSDHVMMSRMGEPRNNCWTFSSMPEIPVISLQDNEFLVDTGVRIGQSLLSYCPPTTSRIPKLQEIINQNRRTPGNSERSCSTERVTSVLDKAKVKRHFSMHEDCLKSRSSSVDQAKLNRCSVNYGDEMTRQRVGKCNSGDEPCVKDDPRSRRYSPGAAKLRVTCDEQRKSKVFDDKSKRCSLIMDKDKTPRFAQTNKSAIDRTKRHSVNYTSHRLPDAKDTRQKFKRHSLEVTEPNDERTARLRRHFNLDVNHNQGMSSKLSTLRSALASGSRTAPVTRASSPVRAGSRLNFDRGLCDDVDDDRREYSIERQLGKFSSSDEEVDKICVRFAYLEPPNIRDDRTCGRVSRLPVWMRGKKL